jgi:long-chain acyl-CoA synthetase
VAVAGRAVPKSRRHSSGRAGAPEGAPTGAGTLRGCARLAGVTANFADLLRAAAERAPDGVALVDAATGESTTWHALDDAVARTARGLERQGLVAGNRVLLAMQNRPELVVALLAVLRARMVAVPVSPHTPPSELRRVAVDSGARLVVADGTTVDAVREVPAEGAGPRLVVVDAAPQPGEVPFEALSEDSSRQPAAPPDPRDPEALALLLYTSGVSTAARAAMVSHRALLAQVEQVAALEPRGVAPGDVVYGALPVFHVYGLSAVLGQVLHAGATLVLANRDDAEAALLHIERYAATVVPAPPQLITRWRERDDLAERLAGVRLLLSGSAPLAPDVVVDLLERFGLTVHQGYGLTEAGAAVTSTLASRVFRPGSVGAALPGVGLRLLDESGRDPEGADPGEVHVAGEQLFSGYWPDCADGPVDGWFATGDLGFLDADGDLFIVDRLRETVVVSGFTVYPREVEEVLLEAEGVLAAAVVGIPDEEVGQSVVAWVEVDPARRTGVEERVAELCATRLARFKQPTRVEVVEELPRTASGKIAKGRLRSASRRTSASGRGRDDDG